MLRTIKLQLLFTALYSILMLLHFSEVRAQADNKEILYLVLDKTTYTPGEVIWFSTFMLNDSHRAPSLRPDILSLALLRQDTSGFSLVKDYLMKNGQCIGSLSLPDSLSTGEYTLIAGTNLLDSVGRPLHVFHSNIVVRSPFVPAIHTSFEIERTPLIDSILIKARVWSSDRDLPKGKGNKIDYSLSHGWKGKVELDIIGRAKILIPKHEIEKSDRILYAVSQLNGKRKNFNMRIPLVEKPLIEISAIFSSGEPVSGIGQLVYWQSKRNGNTPYPIEAILYKDDLPLQDIKTDSDGMGEFYLVPQIGAKYRIESNEGGSITTCHLPEVKARGGDLQFFNPMVHDTLRTTVISTIPGDLSISVRPLDVSYSLVAEIKNHVSKEKRIALPISELSRGVHQVVLFDEHKDTLASRYIFKNYDRSVEVSLKTDREVYKTRDSVKLEIEFPDLKNNESLLTVYCVHKSRIDEARKNQLPSYFFWDYWSKFGAFEHNLLKHERILSNMLNRGEYYLNSFQNIDDTRLTRVEFLGNTYLRDNKKEVFDRSVNLLFKRDSAMSLSFLESGKEFRLNVNDITVKENRKLAVFASSNLGKRKISSKELKVEIESSMVKPMKVLEKEFSTINRYRDIPIVQSDTGMLLKGQPTNMIEEVAVFARARDVRQEIGRNECGDYVCMYGILNCQNHPYGGSMPVKGQVYTINGVRQAYEGCEKDSDMITSLYTGMDFQGMSKSELSANTGATYLSTLYWIPYFHVKNGVEQPIHFFTSDLKGEYQIIVEGITQSGQLVYKEKTIIVE